MATKQFKIGEYAIGGIIKVDVRSTLVTIKALDYYSKNVVLEKTFNNDENSYWNMNDFLNELTSSYYAEKVLEYIAQNSNVSKQLFR